MHQNFNENDNIGKRPPIPGEETKYIKMTDSTQSELLSYMTTPSSSSSQSSSPSCLKWACTLNRLLEDREGVELFKKYAEAEGGIHHDRLRFYFAVEGLKQQGDLSKIKLIVGAIYRFLKKTELVVPEDIKRTIKAGLKDDSYVFKPDIYDKMQKSVEKIINETTYPNFLQSDMYLQYVHNAQSANERNLISQENSTAASSMSISDSSLKLLSRSSTLPTLMEETADGSTGDLNEASGGFSEITNRVPISGSKCDHKVYNNYAPYNPVSRRDSELASLSSGRTDSDTMSISSMSTDGRPQRRHHHHSHRQERRIINENVTINTNNEPFIPRTQRPDGIPKNLSPDEFLRILIPKLEAVKKHQETTELLGKKLAEVDKSNKLFVDAINAKLMLGDDKDDQDILDQHVSRVWSDRTPLRSPGNMSPCNTSNQFQRTKQYETVLSCGSSSIHSSMRSSKSMPDSNMRKFSKWGSINTDSGISLFSSDTMTIKHKDAMSISSGSSSSTSKSRTIVASEVGSSINSHNKLTPQQIEELRRSKRYQQQQPPALPVKNVIPPPLPAKNLPQLPQQQQLHQTQPSSVVAPPEHTTTVVCSFCDEDVPYRIKIPGKSPLTLKQFKESLPKKGNYRFFFKTRCEDEDNPIIQEEVVNDSDVLPLFDDKVMATVKLAS
ncbi:hypothetical protein PVAND_010582 [Polypedilum vanderplanki]|uniref:Axin n=1 Tax=Polypedilum vanderplanki TaxID=319348 RepID=A0A9J6CG22_POLVA|nr:hypothetical protein PVAND_010582 [Polypedilum vanderplanki]